MKIGDTVIINPLITHDLMSGIFQICDYHNSLFILNNGKGYFRGELIPADPLEVGDKVTVKTDLDSMKSFPHGLVSEMRLFEGKTVTISDKCGSDDTDKIGEGMYYYHLQGDPDEYSWPLCAFNTETIIKQSKNHENRLQKHETSVTRRSTELRIGVRCRKHKARVEVSSLKHKKVVGRG